MPLPHQFQELVDWVDQPPPTNSRDTHALRFFLESPEGPDFHGLMLFRPGEHPASPITKEQDGIIGEGSAWGSHHASGPWIRVQLTWKRTTDGEDFPMFATLFFQDDKGKDQFDRPGLPGNTTSEVEIEHAVAIVNHTPKSGHKSDVQMFTGQDRPWRMTLAKTTVSLPVAL